MTKSLLLVLAGAILASAWWAMGTGIIKSEGVFIPVFLVCLFGTLATVAFIATETIDNWKN